MSKQEMCGPVWSEGMFLTPHHLQYLDRHNRSVRWALTKHLAPYAWGFKRLEIDLDALEDFSFKVLECEAVIAGGTILSWPGNLELSARPFKDVMPTDGALMVYLGVPEHKPGGANLLATPAGGEQAASARSMAVEVEQLDDNTGEQPRNIQVKRLRARIFLGAEDRSGYESLPIARLTPGPAGAGARLDPGYAPPALTLAAWRPMQLWVQELSSKVLATMNALKKNLGSEEISGILSSPRGLENSLKLLAVGGSAHVVAQMTQTAAIHPFTLYMELARLFGQLSLFQGGLQLTQPPAYQHDNLGACFLRIRRLLVSLLERLAAPSYLRRSFVLRKNHMQVELQPDWVTGVRQLYLAVRGSEDPEAMSGRVAGIKLCAPQDLEEVRRKRLEAIPIEWLRKAPSPLPTRENLLVGSIKAGGRFWAGVQEDLALDLSGHESLPYQFDLFVV